MIEKSQIFFDTAPYCGACKAIQPLVEQIAAERGAEFYEMDTPDLHNDRTFTLPMMYIYQRDLNGDMVKETVLDGTATVGDIERALGNTSPNFLDNPFTNIGNVMENYFSGIIEIGANGKPSAVSYEEEGNNRMTMIIVGILIVLVIAYLMLKYSK